MPARKLGTATPTWLNPEMITPLGSTAMNRKTATEATSRLRRNTTSRRASWTIMGGGPGRCQESHLQDVSCREGGFPDTRRARVGEPSCPRQRRQVQRLPDAVL